VGRFLVLAAARSLEQNFIIENRAAACGLIYPAYLNANKQIICIEGN